MGRRTTAWVVALALLAAGCGGGSEHPSAADRVPRLGVLLSRIDDDLVAHHYSQARQDLRALKVSVQKARKAGQLEEADATRVLDAAAQLLTELPTSSPAPTQRPTTSPTTPSPSPTKSASSHPAKPRSTAAKPSASPTTAPTTAAPTPSATPSASSPTSTVSPAVASATALP
jgi:hypothetical protein